MLSERTLHGHVVSDYCDILFPLKGGWENDETVEEAAAREAVEEAGVRGDLMVKNFSTVEFIFLNFCTVSGIMQYRKKIVLSVCFNGFILGI